MTYEKPRYSVDRVSAKRRKKQYILNFLRENKKAINLKNNEAFRAAKKLKTIERRKAKILADREAKKKGLST